MKPLNPDRDERQSPGDAQRPRSRRTVSVSEREANHLGSLALALYPLLVLAAPLPGRGALLPVPAALPPFVFLIPTKTNRFDYQHNESHPVRIRAGWENEM